MQQKITATKTTGNKRGVREQNSGDAEEERRGGGGGGEVQQKLLLHFGTRPDEKHNMMAI